MRHCSWDASFSPTPTALSTQHVNMRRPPSTADATVPVQSLLDVCFLRRCVASARELGESLDRRRMSHRDPDAGDADAPSPQLLSEPEKLSEPEFKFPSLAQVSCFPSGPRSEKT